MSDSESSAEDSEASIVYSDREWEDEHEEYGGDELQNDQFREFLLILSYLDSTSDKMTLLTMFNLLKSKDKKNMGAIEARKQQHTKLMSFVRGFTDSVRVLKQLVYTKRKDQNQSGADLGEGPPTLQSLERAISKAETLAECDFLMESYLYIHSRPHSWAPLYIYTTNSYKKINPAIASKDFSVADVKALYEIFTDFALPRLHKDVHVTRCVTSRPGFDVAHASSFSSYQLTSTTLDIAGGICLESKGDDYIAMYLTCNNVPALFIGFKGTTHNTSEREVILCLGLRFVWDKTTHVPKSVTSALKKNGISVKVAPNGQHVGAYGSKKQDKKIFVRNYTARLMDNPVLEKFPIEARTKNLMTFFQYVNAVFLKHREERVNAHVATFIERAKANVLTSGTRRADEQMWSIALNSLLSKIQRNNLEGDSQDTADMQEAERLMNKMLEQAKIIYLPWDFTVFGRAGGVKMYHEDLRKLMKPLRKNAPSTYKLLMKYQHVSFIPWRGQYKHHGRLITVVNEGHAPHTLETV